MNTPSGGVPQSGSHPAIAAMPPAEAPRPDAVAPIAVRPAEPPESVVNILLVDDEPKNLTVLETVLEDPGYRLVAVSSGKQALLEMMADEFAVLVLDVNMPEMSGFELAQLIKQRRKTAHVPIIFLTAYYNEDQHILEGYGSGAVDYLHKPVNAGVLRSKVAIFAELHRRGRALEQANRALLAEVSERRSAQERLGELNDTLERRVAERTQALQASEAQLRDADRRKDEFLATLAHELRNPLAPMRNAVQLLRLRGLDSPDLQRASDVIDRQVRAMSRLIDDLMDVNRINRGRIELQREYVEFASLLQEAVETSRPFIVECGHRLELHLPEGPAVLHADPTRLAQAFLNLLNNAAKYTDRGGRIEIRAQRDGNDVTVAFRDTGIGIAADRLHSVFDMFSQVDTSITRSRGGLGIGLSLSQRLVQLHGGSIVASSEGLGRGSEFLVRLPLAAMAPEALAPPRVEAPAKVAPAREKLRILVADDNQDAARSLAELLECAGHTVTVVFDGEAAVEAARALAPQIIVLDVGMPKLSGYETCRRIRLQPHGGNALIYALTGWGQPEDLRMSEQAGFDRHFVKPVDFEIMLDCIDGFVAGANRR